MGKRRLSPFLLTPVSFEALWSGFLRDLEQEIWSGIKKTWVHGYPLMKTVNVKTACHIYDWFQKRWRHLQFGKWRRFVWRAERNVVKTNQIDNRRRMRRSNINDNQIGSCRLHFYSTPCTSVSTYRGIFLVTCHSKWTETLLYLDYSCSRFSSAKRLRFGRAKSP